MMPKPDSRRPDSDRGSALVIMLVVVMLAALVVVPMLEFGAAMLRFERVTSNKSARIEAVKGALRVAMADPASLYQRSCPSYSQMWTATSGLELADTLAGSDAVRTGCELIGTATADFGGRLDNALVAAGVTAPVGMQGATYLTPDPASISTWFDSDHAADTPSEGKIWLPQLPARTMIERPEASGWAMPSDYGNCRVFFPGTYRSPVTLTSGRVYFASGTYYFEAPITVDGEVEVVVGEGTTPGCASDQEAAFDALAPPAEHGINGLGATFVLGGAARLVLSTSGADVEQTVVFNQRYVARDDVSLRSSHRVSIMTVNGEITSPATVGDLYRAGDLHVPLSTVAGTTPGSITAHGYRPSTRLATAPRHIDFGGSEPVIKINYGYQSLGVLRVAGYVAIPQGFISLSKSVPRSGSLAAFDGGVLAAAAVEQPGVVQSPSVLTISLQAPVVQKTLLLTAVTTSGAPQTVSRLKVQVNANGAFEVNSWTLE